MSGIRIVTEPAVYLGWWQVVRFVGWLWMPCAWLWRGCFDREAAVACWHQGWK